jgi:hypothetical protein
MRPDRPHGGSATGVAKPMCRKMAARATLFLLPLLLIGCGEARTDAPAPGSAAAAADPGEERRLQIYTEVIQAEDRADRDAEQRIPVTCRPGPATRDELQQWTALRADLMIQYRAEVLERYQITDVDLDAIETEAYEKDWPMPRPIDPCAPAEEASAGD